MPSKADEILNIHPELERRRALYFFLHVANVDRRLLIDGGRREGDMDQILARARELETAAAHLMPLVQGVSSDWSSARSGITTVEEALDTMIRLLPNTAASYGIEPAQA